ncbi:glycosyltransferase family 25 protein [Candidatus Phycorickettsia trachydisci]|nr:glycosyltransferase family 25 protein [Candidatus Phycorickettsia trachydisci]
MNGEVKISSRIFKNELIFQTKFNSISKKDIQVFVISLDRTPERYETMKNQLQANDIIHQKFSAVDGYNLNIVHSKTGDKFCGKDLKDMKISILPNERYDILCPSSKSSYFSSGRIFTAGEFGCHCSHREIWHKIVSHNIEYALVLEDDIIFPTDFQKKFTDLINNLPNEWGVIYLYAVVDPAKKIKIKNNSHIIKFRPNSHLVYGTVAYLITFKAAKEMLAVSEGFSGPIDESMSKAIDTEKVRAYQALQISLSTPDHLTKGESIIRSMGRAS